MKKIAIIDLGTNTFNLLVADFTGKTHYSEKQSVGLGKGGINQGVITKDAFERAIQTMQYYKNKAAEWNPEALIGIATSAVRNANNGQELVEAIMQQTDIVVRIISGLEEAKYIYKGVQKAMNLGNQMNLIIDIGAGSVEYIIGNNEYIAWSQSYEIGALRLFENFHTSDPFPNQNIDRLNEYLSKQLASLFEAVKLYKPQTLIGSSGTFDTLAEIDFRKQNPAGEYIENSECYLELSDYYSIANQLIQHNRENRMAIPGMIEMRADMIVVACLLINFTIEQFELKNIRISSFSLKEGILASLLNDEQV
jgi:exopolyphosphatase/guanosine-5'-triphosphate,3'-diphosphate pyrophosphatase